MTAALAPGADVTVTLECNNRCVFCPRTTLRHIHVDRPGELERRLDAIRRRSSRVILTGGELTVLAEAVSVVERCRRRGFEEIALITNARRLAEGDLARRLVAAGLTEVCVTVYDLRPAVHDGLTRTPGSLEQTLAGLDRLLALAREPARPLTVRLNTVLCADNADGLPALLREVHARGVHGFLVADAVLTEGGPEPLSAERIRQVARAVGADPALATADVVWRGFPPCLLDGIDGLVAEPQRIDTAAAGDGELTRYLEAFQGHFQRVAACETCAAGDTCHGLQQRYLAAHGDGAAHPLTRRPTPRVGEVRELDRFERWTDPGRLAVTPTLACQMRCRYCRVELTGRHAPPVVLDRAVDLLLTSARRRLELQFFGGEPLLRRDEVLRTMARAERAAAAAGKELLFTITTNGLRLDPDFLSQLAGHRVRVLFSLDGDPRVMADQRPLARPRDDAYRSVEDNLRALIDSGIPHFVNLVATPEGGDELPGRVTYLAALGVKRFQICYATGPGWTAERRARFCRGLSACLELARSHAPPLRIQNLGARAEPTVLSNDLLVDVDGVLYGDAAIFAEKALPGLRDAYRVGHVDELESFDGLRRSRSENLAILRRVYPEGSPLRRRLDRQLALGREVQATLDRFSPPPGRRRGPATRDHNPLRERLLGGSLRDQATWMRRRPDILALPLLHVVNPCVHDCIFCRSKDIDATPLEGIRAWLAGNDEVGLTRLGLVGNEPLAHPEIDAIVDAARSHGFRRIEAMTTAAPLADEGRWERWRASGMDGFTVPLHGPDARTHDGITRAPGSFRQAMEVLARLRDSGARVHVHANVLRQNLDRLGELEALVEEELGARFCLIPVRPKAAHLPFGELSPSYREMIERLSVRSLVAFPRCVAARIQGDELPAADRISDLLKVYVLDQPFLKPPVCEPCGWRGSCVGTFAAQRDLYGDGELRPVRG